MSPPFFLKGRRGSYGSRLVGQLRDELGIDRLPNIAFKTDRHEHGLNGVRKKTRGCTRQIILAPSAIIRKLLRGVLSFLRLANLQAHQTSHQDGDVDLSNKGFDRRQCLGCGGQWGYIAIPQRRERHETAANTNGDEAVDIADVVYSLWFSFLGGPPPVPPYPDCGLGTSPTDVETCNRQPRSCPR